MQHLQKHGVVSTAAYMLFIFCRVLYRAWASLCCFLRLISHCSTLCASIWSTLIGCGDDMVTGGRVGSAFAGRGEGVVRMEPVESGFLTPAFWTPRRAAAQNMPVSAYLSYCTQSVATLSVLSPIAN
jgi:hypothetical protein